MTKEEWEAIEWEQGPCIDVSYIYPYLDGSEDTLEIYRTLSKSSKK